MTRHYEGDELLAYLDGNDSIADLDVVAAHLRECQECAARLAEVKRDYDVLSDPRVWRGAPLAPPPSRATEYAQLRERLARDTRRAETTFADLLTRPRETWVEHPALAPAACTSALLRRIILAARAEEERAPGVALDLLLIAETLAPLVQERADLPDVEGDLWKERANTLMMLGDYPAALKAVDKAARLYATRCVAAFDLAFTDWLRASIYFEMGRYEESLPLAERAATTLRQFGDRTLEEQVRVLIACVHYEGQHSRGRAPLHEAARPARGAR